MIFDGKQFAQNRREQLKKERALLGELSLGILMSADDPVTSSFVRIKEKNAQELGVTLVRHTLDSSANTKEALEALEKANEQDGIIVQLPLPSGVDASELLKTLPLNKDVDAISEKAVEEFENGKETVMPPVAKAIKEIIDSNNLEIKDKKVVVVGKGKLVGKPSAVLMKNLGGNVVVLGAGDNVGKETINADVIVLGAGHPGLLKSEMVKEGVIVFDAGTSESGGMVVGDADPQVAGKASFFTPVPGGIGPVAVVEIFSNLITLSKNKRLDNL